MLLWGKYAHNLLPMGFCGLLDIVQKALGSMFTDLTKVIVNIDNILVLGDNLFDVYLRLVEEVLACLRHKWFQVNTLKVFWAQPGVEYLGFVTRRKILRPQKKKISSILVNRRPNNQQ